MVNGDVDVATRRRNGLTQFCGQNSGGRGPLVGIARSCARHDCIHLRRDAWVDRRCRRHILTNAFVGDDHGGVPTKRRPPGEGLEEHHAERIDVCAVIGFTAGHLLGCEVVRGAEQHADLRRPGFRQRARQTEIGDLHVTVGGDQDVLGLDVAVDDSGSARMLESSGNLLADTSDLLGAKDAAFCQDASKRLSVDVLHGHIRRGVLVAEVVDLHDVGVRQPRCISGFCAESRYEVGIRSARAEHLERDDAIEHRVTGTVHRAHAARRDEAGYLVAAADDRRRQPVGSDVHEKRVYVPTSEFVRTGARSDAGVA